ncbi:MAG: response regulator transcription factor [Elusimicrobia bacterium]|jgi:DNA-binding response OmpR family regulator|nr:response regulator transcription factor [Elusimicrobiota bacterium]
MAQYIYIIDDDDDVITLVKNVFLSDNFKCKAFKSGEKALKCIENKPPDLLVLDINLEGLLTGADVARVIKRNSETSAIPIIMISGKYTDTPDIVKFLNDGADDYLTKPFSPRELKARAKAILRRINGNIYEDNFLRTKKEEIVINKNTRNVQLKEVSGNSAGPEITELDLTPKEYELLYCFLKHPNEVLSRERLTMLAWEKKYWGTSRTLDKHIQTLRSKLGKKGEMIKTITGVGYEFNDA